MRHILLVIPLALLPIACGRSSDSDLTRYIAAIRAVDNHSHVVSPLNGPSSVDKGYDQLPCSGLPPPTASAPPAKLRFGPVTQSAWQSLYGFAGETPSDEVLKAFNTRRQHVRAEHGAGYHDWILDQAGIDIVLANRVAMTPELGARFKWVPYADALLFPLDNSAEKARTPDRAALFGMLEGLRGEYLRLAGLDAIPPTLDDYVTDVITATLERQRVQRAVAIKLEAAYLRALDFAAADPKRASEIYARFVRGGVPDAADYKTLQDYLFTYLAAEAGRLGLPVHIHTGAGCGEYFVEPGADPMLLSPALNDPALRKTTFVLLHGGAPFDRHVTSLINKPNVYVDTSVLALLFSPASLAQTMRPWLEMMPEHVLFGTDAGPGWGPGNDWEESTWIGAHETRRALAVVLGGMVADGTISGDRAKEIATRVLRQNAVELYQLK